MAGVCHPAPAASCVPGTQPWTTSSMYHVALNIIPQVIKPTFPGQLSPLTCSLVQLHVIRDQARSACYPLANFPRSTPQLDVLWTWACRTLPRLTWGSLSRLCVRKELLMCCNTVVNVGVRGWSKSWEWVGQTTGDQGGQIPDFAQTPLEHCYAGCVNIKHPRLATWPPKGPSHKGALNNRSLSAEYPVRL